MEYFKEWNVDDKIWWFGVIYMIGWFCVGCGWGRELVLQSGTVHHRIGVHFPISYFVLNFVHVGLVQGG